MRETIFFYYEAMMALKNRIYTQKNTKGKNFLEQNPPKKVGICSHSMKAKTISKIILMLFVLWILKARKIILMFTEKC